MCRIGLATLTALAACAGVGQPPGAPPSFREVRTVVLVRSADGRAGGSKDPLDGLDESLRARGYVTRVVEVSAGRSPEQAALQRLFERLEERAGAPRSERFGTRPYGDAGPAAGAAVAELGADAVATYHRLGGRRPLSGAGSTALPGTIFPAPPLAAERGPTGALSLVDRGGHVATFAWGEATELDDPSVPVNAAEAIDLVVRTLAGEPPE